MRRSGRESALKRSDAFAQDALEVGEICRFQPWIGFHLSEHVAQSLQHGTAGLEGHWFLYPDRWERPGTG